MKTIILFLLLLISMRSFSQAEIHTWRYSGVINGKYYSYSGSYISGGGTYVPGMMFFPAAGFISMGYLALKYSEYEDYYGNTQTISGMKPIGVIALVTGITLSALELKYIIDKNKEKKKPNLY
jgi:hypothetical protein